MIVSKPKFNTFFAIGMFLLLSYGSAVYLFLQIIGSPQASWWVYLLFAMVLIVALIITIKMLSSYKKVILDKRRVDVFSFFGLVKKRLHFKDLQSWKEEQVKTSNGVYKQLEVNFEGKNYFRLANQEHDNYEKVSQFLRRNFKKFESKAEQK